MADNLEDESQQRSVADGVSTGGMITAVRQESTTLSLDFECGGSMEIRTPEASARVMVRDKNRQLEYAD